jgi:hypothetical protein
MAATCSVVDGIATSDIIWVAGERWRDLTNDVMSAGSATIVTIREATRYLEVVAAIEAGAWPIAPGHHFGPCGAVHCLHQRDKAY